MQFLNWKWKQLLTLKHISVVLPSLDNLWNRSHMQSYTYNKHVTSEKLKQLPQYSSNSQLVLRVSFAHDYTSVFLKPYYTEYLIRSLLACRKNPDCENDSRGFSAAELLSNYSTAQSCSPVAARGGFCHRGGFCEQLGWTPAVKDATLLLVNVLFTIFFFIKRNAFHIYFYRMFISFWHDDVIVPVLKWFHFRHEWRKRCRKRK